MSSKMKFPKNLSNSIGLNYEDTEKVADIDKRARILNKLK